MEWWDPRELAEDRVDLMRQELEAVARGDEPALGVHMAALYARWLADVAEVLKGLSN